MKTIHLVLIVLTIAFPALGQTIRRPVYRGTYLILTESQRIDRFNRKPLPAVGTATVFSISKRTNFSFTLTAVPPAFNTPPRITFSLAYRIF